MRQTISRRTARPGAIMVAVVVILALMLGVTSWTTFQASERRDDAARWERHTREVLTTSSRLRVAALYTLRGERGYLLTHDRDFLEPYDEGRREMALNLAALGRLVADNRAQAARLAAIEGHVDLHLEVMAAMIELERLGRHDEAIARIRAGEGRRTIEAILNELAAFDAVERDLLARRTRDNDEAMRTSDRYQYLLGAVGLFLLGAGGYAAIALRRSIARETQMRHELQRIAATDELTGLANRRQVLQALDWLMGSARRSGRPLSVAILDIDHFKRVNDTHGHPAGDEVIRRVAELAVEVMRDQDLVGRLGGEEFIIAMPDTDSNHAFLACERFRRALSELSILLPTGHALSITLSTGIAQFAGDDDQIGLIARADEALYRAKQHGRNRVLLAA